MSGSNQKSARCAVGRGLFVAVLVLGAAVAGLAAEAPRPVRVGVLTDNYPFSFRDTDGQIRGFAFELLIEIERVMGLRFERVVGATRDINTTFPSGNIDLLQSFARTPEREEFAEFSVPYLTMEGQIFVREGAAPVRSIADLKGRKVLVHRGSLGEQVLRRAGLDDAIVIVDSVEQALARLDRGEGDATLATRLTGLGIAHKFGLKQVRALAVKIEDYEVRYCFAVRKGDHALLARINEGMALLVRTGKFDEYYQKWFGFVEPAGFTSVQILLGVAAGLAVALGVAVWAVARQRGLARQITRQAEIARESEARYRQLVAIAPVGIAVHADGKLVFINLAGARIIGAQAPEEVIGREALSFVHPTERERTLERIQGLLAGPAGYYAAENVYVRLDGGLVNVDVMSTPLTFAGQPAVQVIFTDVTPRKQAELALQLSDERFRLAARATNDAVWDWNLDSRAMWWSEGFESLFGYKVAELEPGLESWSARLHPDDHDQASASILAVIKPGGGDQWTAEYRFRRRDGTYADIFDRGFVLRDARGLGVRMIGAMQDISHRKASEARLRASEAQLRALAARLHAVREEERTAIAREIHDVLAQELTRLKIDLVWLAKRAAHPVDELIRAALVARVADAIAQTDTAISSVQRIATELRPVILDSLGLPAAIEWQIEDFSRRTGMPCRARVPQGGSALPREAATAIFRILQESLTNVARYARAGAVEVEFAEAGGEATLKVRDDGVGITAEQIANPRAIGLLGMRERALALGGTVEISGSPGRGTTIMVRLPLAPSTP